MKKIVINIGKVLLILVGLLTMFVLSMHISAPYREVKKARNKLVFPNNIQYTYYVDVIKIQDPIVVKIEDDYHISPWQIHMHSVVLKRAFEGDYYILPRQALKEYNGNDSIFINRPDVFLFSSGFYGNWTDLQPYKLRTLYAESCMRFWRNHRGLAVYEFHYPPKDFTLVLYRKYELICTQLPDVFDPSFSKEYEMALYPNFTRKQIKKIEKQYWEWGDIKRIIRFFMDYLTCYDENLLKATD